MSKTSTLRTRRFNRATIDLPVELEVAPNHHDQVRFSTSSDALSAHRIRGRAIDLSSGGMGLELAQFLPRGCEAVIRILADDSAAEHGEECLLTQAIKFRRIYLRTGSPSSTLGDRGSQIYLAGVEFIGSDAAARTRILALRASLNLPPEEVRDDA